MYKIIFDIGGTNIRSCIFKNSKMILREKFDTPNYMKNNSNIESMHDYLLCFISQIIKKYNEHIKADFVAISFAGLINSHGEVIQAPTIWGQMENKYPFLEKLKKLINFNNIIIMNDITAAGYRYIKYNDGTFCIISISSGIGSKIFWKGNVILDEDGYGGELGHCLYLNCIDDKIKCDCGEYGHLGSISSGRGIENISKKMKEKHKNDYINSILYNKNISTYLIVKGIKLNDTFSYLLLKESIKPLAYFISIITNLIGIKKYIIMGGFAESIGNLYKEILIDAMYEFIPFSLKHDELNNFFTMGKNDDNNALIGLSNYCEANYNEL